MKLLETHTTEWISPNGPEAEYIGKLEARGPVSKFSSGESYHFSLALGLPVTKQPDDLDLLVSRDIFFDAFWLLDTNLRRLIPEKFVQLTCADGAKLSLVADEITGYPHSSGEGPEIQIMRPHGPVRCELPDGSVHYYDTTFDEQLAAYNVKEDGFPFLHPQAGAMFYAMYQREEPKMDKHNAFILQIAAQNMPSTAEVSAIMEARGFDAPRIQQMLLGNTALATARRDILRVAV